MDNNKTLKQKIERGEANTDSILRRFAAFLVRLADNPNTMIILCVTVLAAIVVYFWLAR